MHRSAAAAINYHQHPPSHTHTHNFFFNATHQDDKAKHTQQNGRLVTKFPFKNDLSVLLLIIITIIYDFIMPVKLF